MIIISISGLDGSGKSTQIELLKTYLESQSKKVFYFHAVHFSIANKNKIQDTKYKIQNTKSVTNASWLQIQLRKVALFIDLIRFKSLTKKLSTEGYDHILSDRYFYDNIINIAFLKSQHSNSGYELRVTGYGHIPRPDHAFYLKTDPELIMQRDRVPDQGLEYLNKKKELFDLFSKENNLTVIDGNRDKEEIFEEIKKLIIMQN